MTALNFLDTQNRMLVLSFPALSFQGIHFFNISLDITFALQPGCGHIADFAENRPLEPGPVMNPEDVEAVRAFIAFMANPAIP